MFSNLRSQETGEDFASFSWNKSFKGLEIESKGFRSSCTIKRRSHQHRTQKRRARIRRSYRPLASCLGSAQVVVLLEVSQPNVVNDQRIEGVSPSQERIVSKHVGPHQVLQ